MRSTQDLFHFYNKELMPTLKVLEQERRALVNKLNMIAIPIVVLAFGGCYWIYSLNQPRLALYWFVIIFGIGAAISAYLSKGYTSNFKDQVIHKIVHFADPSLQYFKTAYIPLNIFQASQIFAEYADVYDGDDYVKGTIGSTAIEFSEIVAKKEVRDSKGRRHYTTFFKGLFFIADFNKHFHGKTFVLPDTAEKIFGGFGQMFQKMNISRPDLVKLENPEFEKDFAVYSENQVEARYILSTSLMQRILNFKKKCGRKVYLSFVGSKVYVAIRYSKNLFEPKIFQTLLNFTPIKEYFEDLQLAIGIVEDLNLNTRIWTKH